jgi:hypothetical protein
MPRLSRRSAPTPRRHRCPTDRSIRYRRRAHPSSRRLMRAGHSRSSARITSSRELRHRAAGEAAHGSARSRGFAGGARARLTLSFPCIACRKRRWEIEMDDRAVRMALERHWAASDASDFNVEHEIYREDAVLDYPQSGERIRGRHTVLRGEHHGIPRRTGRQRNAIFRRPV